MADVLTSFYENVKDGYDWLRINLHELQYVESEVSYLTFHEMGKKTLARMLIDEAAETLRNNQFMRIQELYMMALNYIKKIEWHQLTIGKVQVPLSGSYKNELLERVK